MATSPSRNWHWLDVIVDVRSLVGRPWQSTAETTLSLNASGRAGSTQEMTLPYSARDREPDPDLGRRLEMAQRLETLGQLASSITHDFHNLLTVIMGYGDMLKETLDSKDLMRQRLVREIQNSASQGASLTQQLLAYSRRPQSLRVATDLNGVLAGLDRIFKRLLGQRIDVQLRTGDRLGRVEADPARLQQVVMNLVLNARDAMPEGGQLRIETANVSLSAAEDHPAGAYVRLTIADSGCGMDEGVRDRVFEPFFTTKPSGRGTGLGLTIVHEIVEELGGRVTVQSAPGAGTAFHVYLPRMPEAHAGFGKPALAS